LKESSESLAKMLNPKVQSFQPTFNDGMKTFKIFVPPSSTPEVQEQIDGQLNVYQNFMTPPQNTKKQEGHFS